MVLMILIILVSLTILINSMSEIGNASIIRNVSNVSIILRARERGDGQLDAARAARNRHAVVAAPDEVALGLLFISV